MSQITEKDFIQQIADRLGTLGYNVTEEPKQVPNRKMWQYDPPSVFRGPKHKADLLVQNGDKFAVVEAMTRPFLMGGVIRTHDLAEYFGGPAVICIPDDVLQEIPDSVRRFADEANIKISPMSTLAVMLHSLLLSSPHGDREGK